MAQVYLALLEVSGSDIFFGLMAALAGVGIGLFGGLYLLTLNEALPAHKLVAAFSQLLGVLIGLGGGSALTAWLTESPVAAAAYIGGMGLGLIVARFLKRCDPRLSRDEIRRIVLSSIQLVGTGASSDKIAEAIALTMSAPGQARRLSADERQDQEARAEDALDELAGQLKGGPADNKL